jgi:hypothetical protein
MALIYFETLISVLNFIAVSPNAANTAHSTILEVSFITQSRFPQSISKTDLGPWCKNRISPKHALPAKCKSNGQSLAAQQSDG